MRIALVLTTLLTLAPAAFADPAPAPATAPAGAEHVTNDCAIARQHNKTCVIDMGGEEVDGTVGKNAGFDTMIATFSKHGSLIRLRKDFIDQIVKTAEDL